MSDARDVMLGRIRLALRDVAARGDPIDEIPRRFHQTGRGDRTAMIAGFTDRARGYKVRVEHARRADARALAARILGERGHVRLVLPPDFPDELTPEGFDLLRDDALDNMTIAACDGVITLCTCAIAQTGTIVLDHGVGQGRRTLTLLPDYHLCFVEADAIVELVPQAVSRMEPSVKAGRPLTFISGPSATSDIELIRVEGVHGPRTLDVIVIDG